jgi:hypothetical protein
VTITLAVSVISGFLFLIVAVLNSVFVVLFCLQKLSFYLATHLISTSALVWKATIWFTVAGAITYVAQAFLFLREFWPHIEFPGAHRTQTTTSFVPPPINFMRIGLYDEYETLGNNCIRILELLPSDDSQPVSCRLHRASLKNLPRYEALSYTWGTEKPDCVISIDGKRFMIPRNLYNALRVFQPSLATESRWIWIDALCINQEDSSERVEQVLKMSLIYSGSWRLLIWLGVEADDSAWAVAAITEFGKSACEGEAATRIWEEVFMSGQTSLRTQSAVASLLNRSWFRRSWFRRSWIVQEYVLSYDKTRIFYCGDGRFEPADFNNRSATGSLLLKIDRQLDFDSKNVVALRERQPPQLLQDLSILLPSGLEDIGNNILRSYQASRLLSINEQTTDTLSLGFMQLSKVFLLSQSYEDEAQKREVSAYKPSCNPHSCETMTTRRNTPASLQHTLLSQLTLLRGMEATDPRDKIYSLLGLFQNPN